MNANRLLELVNFLIEAEARLDLQGRVSRLADALANLAQNPQDAETQRQTVTSLNELEDVLRRQFVDNLSPAQVAAIDEIEGGAYYSSALTNGVRAGLAANGLTPTVVLQEFATLRDERRAYVEALRTLSTSLQRVGIEAPVPMPGEAELGFLIPRGLFRNELEGLSKEFHSLDRIVSYFGEATLGKHEPATVRTISTTDPLIFLGLDVRVVVEIAMSVTWLLSTWKLVLDIKKVRGDAKVIGLSEVELRIFEDKADKLIEAKVRERVDALMAKSPIVENRRNEVDTALEWAHRGLLARIERGMTVEVRFLPAPLVEGGEADEGDGSPFETLRELSPHLEFPQPTGDHILKLPSFDPPRAE